MISYLEGKIILKTEKCVVLNVGGVGFKVFLSKKSLSKIPEKEEVVKLFCSMSVRENSIELYGFLNSEELEFFDILDGIRGIGPKAALEISSIGPLGEIKEKISKGEAQIFSGIPGIGQKKAMAIMIELSGKIKEAPKSKINGQTSGDVEAEEALANLGFQRQQIKEALKNIPAEKTVDEKIKKALKILR